MATEWYYTKSDQQHGPVSSSKLKSLAQSGHLTPQDMVRTDGMTEWKPAGSVKGLFSTAPEITPPPLPQSTGKPPIATHTVPPIVPTATATAARSEALGSPMTLSTAEKGSWVTPKRLAISIAVAASLLVLIGFGLFGQTDKSNESNISSNHDNGSPSHHASSKSDLAGLRSSSHVDAQPQKAELAGNEVDFRPEFQKAVVEQIRKFRDEKVNELNRIQNPIARTDAMQQFKQRTDSWVENTTLQLSKEGIRDWVGTIKNLSSGSFSITSGYRNKLQSGYGPTHVVVEIDFAVGKVSDEVRAKLSNLRVGQWVTYTIQDISFDPRTISNYKDVLGRDPYSASLRMNFTTSNVSGTLVDIKELGRP